MEINNVILDIADNMLQSTFYQLRIMQYNLPLMDGYWNLNPKLSGDPTTNALTHYGSLLVYLLSHTSDGLKPKYVPN